MNKVISKYEWLIVAILAGATLISFITVHAYVGYDSLLKVYFLDVGQGDAIFIEAPNGNQVLIDGGPDNSVLQQLGKIMPLNDHSIDLVVLTHPHTDHVNGLIEVLKRYSVARIMESHENYPGGSYAEWDKIKTQAEVTQARAGQIVDLGRGVTLQVLYPYVEAPQDHPLKNAHESMVVTRLVYGDESVMLTGDMEAPVERELVDKGVDVSAKFLKVGHHGSKTSTSEAFLNAVNPKLAFIEVGAGNRYGLPYHATLEHLDNHAIKYYRTDIDGSVELVLDGHNYLINKL